MVRGLTVFDVRCIRLSVCSAATLHPFFDVYFGFWCMARSSSATEYHQCYLDEDKRSNRSVFLNGMARETFSRRVIFSADRAMTCVRTKSQFCREEDHDLNIGRQAFQIVSVALILLPSWNPWTCQVRADCNPVSSSNGKCNN